MIYLIRFLTAITTSLWAGYVLSAMWTWYAESIGAPHVGAVRAMGIMFMVDMLNMRIPTHAPAGKKYTNIDGFAIGAIVEIVVPAIVLLLGWLWKNAL
jgi:hypothetical protein